MIQINKLITDTDIINFHLTMVVKKMIRLNDFSNIDKYIKILNYKYNMKYEISMTIKDGLFSIIVVDRKIYINNKINISHIIIFKITKRNDRFNCVSYYSLVEKKDKKSTNSTRSIYSKNYKFEYNTK